MNYLCPSTCCFLLVCSSKQNQVLPGKSQIRITSTMITWPNTPVTEIPQSHASTQCISMVWRLHFSNFCCVTHGLFQYSNFLCMHIKSIQGEGSRQGTVSKFSCPETHNDVLGSCLLTQTDVLTSLTNFWKALLYKMQNSPNFLLDFFYHVLVELYFT